MRSVADCATVRSSVPFFFNSKKLGSGRSARTALHPHPKSDFASANSLSDLSRLAPADQVRSRGRGHKKDRAFFCSLSHNRMWARATEKGRGLFYPSPAPADLVRRRKLGEVGERVCASKIALRVRVQVRSEQTPRTELFELKKPARRRHWGAIRNGADPALRSL